MIRVARIVVSLCVLVVCSVAEGPEGTPEVSEVYPSNLRGGGSERRLQQSGGGFDPVLQIINFVIRVVLQIIFGAIFYSLVVSKHSAVMAPSAQSQSIMAESPVFRCPVGPLCIHSWCCQGMMMGFITDKTGALEYWPSMLVSAFCPCCVMMYATTSTDMNAKLGGSRMDIATSCMMSWCCLPCLITQTAEALDAATGETTACCDVSGGQARQMNAGGMVMVAQGQLVQPMNPGGMQMQAQPVMQAQPMYTGGMPMQAQPVMQAQPMNPQGVPMIAQAVPMNTQVQGGQAQS